MKNNGDAAVPPEASLAESGNAVAGADDVGEGLGTVGSVTSIGIVELSAPKLAVMRRGEAYGNVTVFPEIASSEWSLLKTAWLVRSPVLLP